MRAAGWSCALALLAPLARLHYGVLAAAAVLLVAQAPHWNRSGRRRSADG